MSDVPPLPQRKGNKTEQAMYFLKTVKKGSEHRLVPLKHQMIDGEPVDTTMNVRASHSMREAYPLGTVFATLSLIPSGSHYSAQRIFPMVPAGELADSAHTPSAEMVDAYQSFKMRYGIETDFDSREKTSVFSSPASLFDEVPPAAQNYTGRPAVQDTKDAVDEVTRMGFAPVQIAINASYDPSTMFSHYVVLEDLANLPKDLGRIIKDAILRNTSHRTA